MRGWWLVCLISLLCNSCDSFRSKMRPQSSFCSIMPYCSYPLFACCTLHLILHYDQTYPHTQRSSYSNVVSILAMSTNVDGYVKVHAEVQVNGQVLTLWPISVPLIIPFWNLRVDIYLWHSLFSSNTWDIQLGWGLANQHQEHQFDVLLVASTLTSETFHWWVGNFHINIWCDGSSLLHKWDISLKLPD
jgi:hypothetical protein